MNRPPVVTDADRAWALAQKPWWFRAGHDDATPMIDPEECDADDEASDVQIANTPPVYIDADGAEIILAADVRSARRYDAPRWGEFVDEQCCAFERYFAAERKSPDAWTKLFRTVWWPKADPSKRYPHSKPLRVPSCGYAFLRPGTAIHRAALTFAPTAAARRVWASHGVQFAADDPLLAGIRKSLTERACAAA